MVKLDSLFGSITRVRDDRRQAGLYLLGPCGGRLALEAGRDEDALEQVEDDLDQRDDAEAAEEAHGAADRGYLAHTLSLGLAELGTCGIFVIFSLMKNFIFCIFYQVNLTGVGFLNRMTRNRLQGIGFKEIGTLYK